MTLSDLKKIAEAATPGKWTVDHPGHGERCEPAYLRLPAESGSYEVIVDHRRDYSDPAPDARFISTFNPEMVKRLLAVVEVAEAFTDYDYEDSLGFRSAGEVARLREAFARLRTK